MTRGLPAWLVVLVLLAGLALPAGARQVVAMVDDAAARPERLAPGTLNRLLLQGIRPGDDVHIALATAAYGDVPAGLTTLVRFAAHPRPAIRNAQLLAAADALAGWRRSEASHAAPKAPGSLAPLLVRLLEQSVDPAAPLRLVLAGRLTPAPPPDRAMLRRTLPSATVVAAVDLGPAPAPADTEAEDGETAAVSGGDADAAQPATLADWRAALAAAGARWDPPALTTR